MAVTELETRITALETEIERLKKRMRQPVRSTTHWVDEVYGAFANDPDFREAMRLGRQYRKAQRPKTRQTKRTAKRTKR